jgi:hypothetical protein
MMLPVSYYEKSLEKIEDYKIIFVGDNISFAKEHFSHIPNSTFEQNDAIVDFQIILNADIAIIANSSFAWWAAWLNPNPNKKIIAPKYWVGFKGAK